MPNPILFSIKLNVLPEHLDELNHVNNVVFLGFIQKVAIEHWYSAVPVKITDSIRWVAKRHEIDYLGQAFLNETLEIKTYVSKFNGLRSIRCCEIYKENKLVLKSKSEWVALDAETLRPKRLKLNLDSYFFD